MHFKEYGTQIEYIKLDHVLSLQNELVFVVNLLWSSGFREPYLLGPNMISTSFLKGLQLKCECNAYNIVTLLKLIIFCGQ